MKEHIYSDGEITHFVECKNNFHEYLKQVRLNYGRDGDIDLRSVILRPYQKMVIDSYLQNRNTFCINPRQMGITILQTVLALHYATFNNNTTTLFVSSRSENDQEYIQKVKNLHKWLPRHLKYRITSQSHKHIRFENDSTIMFVTASKDTGVGYGVDNLIIDHLCTMEREIIDNLLTQTFILVNCRSGGKVLITTLNDPITNEYFDKYTENGSFHPCRIYWFEGFYLDRKKGRFLKRDDNWKKEQIKMIGEDEFKKQYG